MLKTSKTNDELPIEESDGDGGWVAVNWVLTTDKLTQHLRGWADQASHDTPNKEWYLVPHLVSSSYLPQACGI